ncbi:MAG TPA: glycosyltransferase family 1 protein [Trebonia sp.]|nr:glycosyltransferase family 1 protein [Trebonia sp.]
MADPRPSALVYGDVDMNLLDGSAIWLQSVTQALVAAGCAVTLVLKAPIRTDRLVAPMLAMDEVTVRLPHEEQLSPGGATPRTPRGTAGETARIPAMPVLPGLGEASLTVPQAITVLAALDEQRRHDLVVLRGRALVSAAARHGAFDGRLWSYLTDVPQAIPAVTPQAAGDLTQIARASRYLLCQTEELRCFLEGSVAAACGKSVLFPPVLPQDPVRRDPQRPVAQGAPLRLVYTGKFAPRWNTLEMTELPALLAKRGVSAEVDMVGDKIHNDPRDPTYNRRMAAALGPPGEATPREPGTEGTPGVVWHGGKPRAEAMAIAAAGDIGLSWRHPELDASLELSTKVLEFGALGLPVILNRTPMHEALLGADYPLFAASLDDVADVAAAAAADPAVFALAASRTAAATQDFTMERAAARLRRYLSQSVPGSAPPGGLPAPTLRVVIAGHDLKFFTPLVALLRLQPGVEVRLDQWAALGEHDPDASRELAEWADVVVCEWCGPNAVWYSRHKRRGSRLVVHLHRFELYSDYPGQVKVSAVDQVVCVSDAYRQLTLERTGWPAAKVMTIANPLNTGQLDRAKLDGARFGLGLIGIVPSRKRLDWALDILEELRRHDDRYTLSVKSGMPWEHWWVWSKPEERDHYTSAFRRIQRSPWLRDAVVFDDAGPDVPAWLRRIGFVLSTSDDESFHVAPAEGMASRAVPVIRHWPGAETIYDRRWLHETPLAMAAAIAAFSPGPAGERDWRATGELAREQVLGWDLADVTAAWHALLAGMPASAPGAAYELQGS